MEKEGEGGQGNGGRRAKRGDREAGQLGPSHTNKPMFSYESNDELGVRIHLPQLQIPQLRWLKIIEVYGSQKFTKM